MNSWILKDEVLRSVRQWYFILGLIILGTISGYLISYVLPAPYRASADLYVGLDVARVNEMEYLIPSAKTEPLNLDDYKNWQLKQVSDVITLDLVLDSTLIELREIDPYWEDINTNDFRKSIDIYWYDAGIWRLEVLNLDRERAEQGVQVWLDTGQQKISDLLIISEQVFLIDLDLQILKDLISHQKSQINLTEAFLESSEEWLSRLDSLPKDNVIPGELLEELESWTLVYNTDSELWQVPMGEYPTNDQEVEFYESWLEDARLNAQTVMAESTKKHDFLILDRSEILPEYHEALNDSLGLSANLVLEKNSSKPDVTQLRSPATNAIAGAGLGLLVWIIYAILRITGKKDVQN